MVWGRVGSVWSNRIESNFFTIQPTHRSLTHSPTANKAYTQVHVQPTTQKRDKNEKKRRMYERKKGKRESAREKTFLNVGNVVGVVAASDSAVVAVAVAVD